MARISDLPVLADNDVDGSEMVPAVKGGASFRASVSQLGLVAAERSEVAAGLAVDAAEATMAIGRYRATVAAGVADFAVGELFTSDQFGELAIYKRVAGAPGWQYHKPVGTPGLFVPEMFGAKGDTTVTPTGAWTLGTNDKAAVEACLAAIVAAGGGTLFLNRF